MGNAAAFHTSGFRVLLCELFAPKRSGNRHSAPDDRKPYAYTQSIPYDLRALTHRVVHVTPLVLASGSAIRADLLRRANVPVEVVPARVDEDAIRSALLSEDAKPRDIADALAEAKARKVASRHPDRMVLGCDQVLDFQGTLLSKPETPDDAREQLRAMRGKRHMLLSAAVIYDQAKPVWRHVGTVRLQTRDLSDAYVDDYVSRNWESIRHAVGAYKLEEEGPRLFTRIEGDHFNVLGLPLLEILSYLTLRGTLPA